MADAAGPERFARMLERMSVMLHVEFARFEKEAARLGGGAGAEGPARDGAGTARDAKANVDLIALIARTQDKLNEMLRDARAGSVEPESVEREKLAARVAERIEAIVAERLVQERARKRGRRGDHGE